jgi:uncharacterized protein
MDRREFILGSTAAVAVGANTSEALALKRRRRGGVGDTEAKYLVLTCDGGGMRGYLSSLILQALGQDLDIFGSNNGNIDLYAGTSTGGLIALALAYGKSVDDVVSLYRNSGAQIFTPLTGQAICVLSLSQTLRAATTGISGLWQALFNNTGATSVRSVVEDFIPGNPSLGSLPNKVLVTTFQLAAQLDTGTSWNPLVIDNLSGGNGGSTQLYDAALSTSAAPVYFPPYSHPKFGWCSDGGLFANNPAPQAIARLIETGVPISNISLLSVGTGFTNASLSVSRVTRLCYGLKKWAWIEQNGPTPPMAILNSIMDGVSATNDYLCSQLLGDRYLRINPVLPKSVALDDYSPATMQMFEDTANSFINSSAWSQVADWAQANFQK